MPSQNTKRLAQCPYGCTGFPDIDSRCTDCNPNDAESARRDRGLPARDGTKGGRS